MFFSSFYLKQCLSISLLFMVVCVEFQDIVFQLVPSIFNLVLINYNEILLKKLDPLFMNQTRNVGFHTHEK